MVPRRLIVGAIIAAAAGRRLWRIARCVDRTSNCSSATGSLRHPPRKSNDGLGPLYNATSCARVSHPQSQRRDRRNDRARPARSCASAMRKATGDPIYGRQLQTRAVARPDARSQSRHHVDDRQARAASHRSSSSVWVTGRSQATRRSRCGARRRSSASVCLAQIPDQEILKRADPDDANQDGISGRAAHAHGRRKASARPLRLEGNAARSCRRRRSMAFRNDMGLSTTRIPNHGATARLIRARAARLRMARRRAKSKFRNPSST